jgi:hypothetical protein
MIAAREDSAAMISRISPMLISSHSMPAALL